METKHANFKGKNIINKLQVPSTNRWLEPNPLRSTAIGLFIKKSQLYMYYTYLLL